jgi:hypothetical protein
MGEWMYSTNIFDLGTRWMGVVSLTPVPLYLRGSSPRYPDCRDKLGPRARVDVMEKETLALVRCQMIGRSVNNNLEPKYVLSQNFHGGAEEIHEKIFSMDVPAETRTRRGIQFR